MVANVLKELSIMHLLAEQETYKITFGTMTSTWKNYKTFSESGKDYMLDGFLISG
jgi:hypothetical protein